ncbi:NACHT domain-containing protein [Cladophialophora immunda]|nr:NACHT domain-containing protein [Cladophialophora immunda]
MANQRDHHREDYTVGWVCALPIELAAAKEMLDEEHEAFDHDANDTNIYSLGKMCGHNVVIACLPEGQPGTNSAATVAVQMKSAFRSLRFGLMVGIGGGVPSDEADIRLGDVVVSKPQKRHGGVVQYDFGKATPSGFERTSFLNNPPTLLLNAIASLRANYIRGKCKLSEYLSKLDCLPVFARDTAGPDVLFEANYNHVGGAACGQCSKEKSVTRQPREQRVVVHYGTIASGNQVMRDAIERDKVSAELGGVLCFEMEAAGLMNSFPCLVIRGICDYADSHKSKKWQAYAAGTAAAYAKEVLSVVRANTAMALRTMEERDRETKQFLRTLYTCPYADRKDRNRERIAGTCEWFIHHSIFQNWKSDQGPSLLWVSADPGCGKSVLAKYLVDHIFPTTIEQTTCYFFFKDDFTDQKSAVNALCAILRQLFLAKPHLLQDSILDRYDVDGDNFLRSFRELWSTLITVATDQKAGEIVCILDALDECQDSDRSQLIHALKHLSAADPKRLRLKMLLTSSHMIIYGVNSES